MPAESSTLRFSARQDSDLSARRNRGEISCAECRRLKLKCDRKLPCSSCIRRGCPSICPNGSLTAGHSTRFVLADTSQLHGKITTMGERIAQLEEALTAFQSTVSNETHPLLTPDLLSIKFSPDNSTRSTDASTDAIDETIDALGTLTIGENGQAKYFGRSGGNETLFLAGATSHLQEIKQTQDVPLDIAQLAHSFPFGPDGSTKNAFQILYNYLPDRNRAWSLCETYLEHGTWTFRALTREELIDDLLMPIYTGLKNMELSGVFDLEQISPHKMALLFLIFAHGALLDLTLPPYNVESERYYYLGRAALSLRSYFNSPEVATVQATCLIGLYHSVSGKLLTFDSTWSVFSLGAKLAQSLGLHRDATKWNMDQKTVQRRRSLFFEIFCTEIYFSLALGRPPAIRVSYMDCQVPVDDDAPVDKDGRREIGYFQWKHEFCRDIFSEILERTQTATPPTYQTILDLDRKVQEKTLPPHLSTYMDLSDPGFTPLRYIRGCILTQYRSLSLLFIHRSFFAQALLDHPDNPSASPFSKSFTRAYECASVVIQAAHDHFSRFPDLCYRWLTLWLQLFSAANIMGGIVTRSPSATIAGDALSKLESSVKLFGRAAMYSSRIHDSWTILSRLRDKAVRVYCSDRQSAATPLRKNKGDYGDDELAHFGGQTRVLVTPASQSQSQGNSPQSVELPSTSRNYVVPPIYPPSDYSLAPHRQAPVSQQPGNEGSRLPGNRDQIWTGPPQYSLQGVTPNAYPADGFMGGGQWQELFDDSWDQHPRIRSL